MPVVLVLFLFSFLEFGFAICICIVPVPVLGFSCAQTQRHIRMPQTQGGGWCEAACGYDGFILYIPKVFFLFLYVCCVCVSVFVFLLFLCSFLKFALCRFLGLHEPKCSAVFFACPKRRGGGVVLHRNVGHVAILLPRSSNCNGDFDFAATEVPILELVNGCIYPNLTHSLSQNVYRFVSCLITQLGLFE